MLDTRPLRSSTFRHLAAAYSINELGNWIGDVALALLVFDRTHSPIATAALFLALRFAPALLAPLFTTRVEALPARRILPALHLGEAAIFAAIAVITHHFDLPAVFVLAALDGMLAITAKALTRSATAAGLLTDGLLREGNAILNMGFTIGGAVGPALAGLVVAARGPGTALILDSASFAAVAVILGTARGLRLDSNVDVGSIGRLRAGLHEVRHRLGVRRLLVALSLVLMFGAAAVPIEVVFAERTLHAGDSGYGLLLGSWGIGMIAGGGAFAAARRVRVVLVLTVGTVLIALGYAGLAISGDLLVACLFSAVGGIGNGSAWIAAVTAIQQAISSTAQSAVMAVLESINQVMPAIGFILGGAVTALGSPRTAYIVSAAGVGLVVLIGIARPLKDLEVATAIGEASPLPGALRTDG